MSFSPLFSWSDTFNEALFSNIITLGITFPTHEYRESKGIANGAGYKPLALR